MPDDRRRVFIEMGDYALTERRGLFFGVGFYEFVTGPHEGEARPVRCCEEGHADPGAVDDCWEDETKEPVDA